MRWWLLVLVGCGHPHYSLSAPPPDASPFVRMQAFEQLRPAVHGARTTCSNRGGCSTQHYLVLGDGREIWNFEDLAPVVEPNSAAGESVHRLARADHHRRVWRNVFLGTVVGGIALAYAGDKADSHALRVAAVTTIVAGVAIGGFGWLASSMSVNEEKTSLVDQYQDGLARRLNICTRGPALTLVPCDAPFIPLPQDPVLRSLPQR